MPLYNFDAERERISEYEDRTQLVERRAPTRKSERPEPRNWSDRIKVANKNTDVIDIGLSEDEKESLKGVRMSSEQTRYHQDMDIKVQKKTTGRDGRGVFLDYQVNQFQEIWGKEVADEILAKLEKDTNTFNEHYPAEPPKLDDPRFKDLYETDKKNADALGLPYGVHHLGSRR